MFTEISRTPQEPYFYCAGRFPVDSNPWLDACALLSFPHPPYSARLFVSEEIPHRLAIMDLGTNTFHLLLLELNRDGEGFRVLEKYKEYVKLGEGGINAGHIAPEPWERGLEALKRFRFFIDAHSVTVLRAYATSAIRGSDNGPAFVAAAREQVGIPIQVISGNEEAALIYQGVRKSIPFPEQEQVLLCDIGGGSVEFVVGTRYLPRLLRSLDIGAARRLEHFPLEDPPSPETLRALREAYRRDLGPLLSEIRALAPTQLIGSSGTFETLGSLIAHRRNNAGGRKSALAGSALNGFHFTPQEFDEVLTALTTTTRRARLNLPGMEKPRVDMIVPGSLLVAELLQALPLEKIVVSTGALKEGMIYNYLLEEHHRPPVQLALRPNREERMAALRSLGEKYQALTSHTEQIRRLALALFDQSPTLHGYADDERELLEGAAVLHTIGQFISTSGYQRHSCYIIQHSELPGFTNEDRELLALVTRYHRKQHPQAQHKDHKAFDQLHPHNQERVRRLAALLRLAHYLNRSKQGLVTGLELAYGEESAQLKLLVRQEPEVELKKLEKNKALFEEVYGLKLSIQTRSAL